MSGEIESVKTHLLSISNLLAHRKPAPDLRFGAVFYRDIGDKELVRVVPLSKDLPAVRQAILDVKATGGGDWPEHVGIGLHKALEMDWSHSANVNGTDGVRLIYLVGDAPPKHYNGGYDVPAAVELAKKLRVKIHVIGCRGIERDQAQFEEIAVQTGGEFSFLERGANEQHRSPPIRGTYVRKSAAATMSAATYLSRSREGMIDGPVVGIDLGSSSACVGIYKNGRVEIIPNNNGDRLTPSYVNFMDAGPLVGRPPLGHNLTQTLFDFKRLLGRNFSDPEVQEIRKTVPYKLVDDGKPVLEVQVEGEVKRLLPEEVSSKVLRQMKEIAENYLGKEVKHAVMAVPAHFNDAQRIATKDAGTLAGLNVLRIINEPTAAAIAYGLDKKEEHNILVYDLGGRTLEVTVLSMNHGVFEVVASEGEAHLGGSDFDSRLVQHLRRLLKEKHKMDVNDGRQLQKLQVAAEKAKRVLSSARSTVVEIPDLYRNFDFNASLTRARFESLNADLFKKTLLPLERVLNSSGLNKADIHEVLLVGGSTRMPKIRQMIEDFFVGKKANSGINPDEAVAYGAAIQAGVLSGEGGSDLLLLDVTPLTLGVESTNGTMKKLISRNTVMPTKWSTALSTEVDHQRTMTIHICEGERPLVKDNHKLGAFNISGIPPAKAGQQQVEVTFEIDTNGILHVQAEVNGTGISEKLVITNDVGRLTEEEIENMIEDANAHYAEDLETILTNAKAFGLESEEVEMMRTEAKEHNDTDKRRAREAFDLADDEDMAAIEMKGLDSLSTKLFKSMAAEL
jgi:heat shock protein 5